MSDGANATTPRKTWLPDTSHGFWRVCLLASLMVNLVIAGMLASLFLRNPMDRPDAASYGMIVPRKFFADINRERRHELGAAFRAARPDFERLRLESDDLAGQVASELVNPAYDGNKVSALIDSFTTGPESIAAHSATVLKDFFVKLTPDERKLLANDIQERLRRHKERS
jgi:uncharacterized membrane protein